MATPQSRSPGERISDFFTRPPPTSFIRRVNQALIIAAIAAIAISLLLGILLARTLIRPLRELTVATHAVAAGDLAQQVPVRSQDELGELAKSFNQMNATLAHSRDLRRQMTADIAHDLRTPLSIITGHAEGLSDGVLPADQETFDIILDEAQRLSRLVEDLRTLSLAEAGELPLHRTPTSPQLLLERTISSHTPQAQRKDITLMLEMPPILPDINADADRMAQVLGNLMTNALHYTPTQGQITLAATQQSGFIEITIQDSGPGIAPDELAHVFDRFYRGDKARQRHSNGAKGGGSGLGLAIAKSIVEGHGGTIRAESEQKGGARFVVTLPVVASNGDG